MKIKIIDIIMIVININMKKAIIIEIIEKIMELILIFIKIQMK
jgi:hypothetical protein